MDGSLLGGFEYEGRPIQNCPPALHEAIASTLQPGHCGRTIAALFGPCTDKRARRYTQPAVSDSPLGDYAYNALREVADGPGATGFRHYIYVSIQTLPGRTWLLDQVAETSKQRAATQKANRVRSRIASHPAHRSVRSKPPRPW